MPVRTSLSHCRGPWQQSCSKVHLKEVHLLYILCRWRKILLVRREVRGTNGCLEGLQMISSLEMRLCQSTPYGWIARRSLGSLQGRAGGPYVRFERHAESICA